jgi:hypothetical protein
MLQTRKEWDNVYKVLKNKKEKKKETLQPRISYPENSPAQLKREIFPDKQKDDGLYHTSPALQEKNF